MSWSSAKQMRPHQPAELQEDQDQNCISGEVDSSRDAASIHIVIQEKKLPYPTSPNNMPICQCHLYPYTSSYYLPTCIHAVKAQCTSAPYTVHERKHSCQSSVQGTPSPQLRHLSNWWVCDGLPAASGNAADMLKDSSWTRTTPAQ